MANISHGNSHFLGSSSSGGSSVDLSTVPENSIPANIGGTLQDSGIKVINNRPVLPHNATAEIGSISFGDISALTHSASFLTIVNRILQSQNQDVTFSIIDYPVHKSRGSDTPRYVKYASGSTTESVFTNDVDEIPLTGTGVTFNWTPTFTGKIHDLNVRFGTAVSNLRVRIYDTTTNVNILHEPSFVSFEEETNGLDFGTGDQTIFLGRDRNLTYGPNQISSSQIFVNAGDTISFQIMAESGTIKGNSGTGVPFLSILRQVGEFVDLVDENRLNELSYDNYRGTIASSGSTTFNVFPQGNEGDYVLATDDTGTVDGVSLTKNVTYRCNTDNTPISTPANWIKVPTPPGDIYRGTAGQVGASFSEFPSAEEGHYVIALDTNPGVVSGITLEAGRRYRCTQNNTPANTGANWTKVELPADIVTQSDLTTRLNSLNADTFLGLIGAAGTDSDFNVWPAANTGDYVRAANVTPGTVGGVDLSPDRVYRCDRENTPENTPSQWLRIPIPGGFLTGSDFDTRINSLELDRFRGTIGAAGGTFSDWPSGNAGDYLRVVGTMAGTVGGVDLSLLVNRTYRCNTNGTVAGTPGNWILNPVPPSPGDIITWYNLPLVNSWVGFSPTADFRAPRYCKENNGFVTLEGTISGGGNSIVARLPVGFRPEEKLTYAAPVINAGASRIHVRDDGYIQITTSYVNNLVGLSGIRFHTPL